MCSTKGFFLLRDRTDLEKAIAAQGGPHVVAEALGWRQKSRVRRPNGYWDDLDNMRRGIDEFVEEAGMVAGKYSGLKGWHGVRPLYA